MINQFESLFDPVAQHSDRSTTETITTRQQEFPAAIVERSQLAKKLLLADDLFERGHLDAVIEELDRLRKTAIETCNTELAEVVCHRLAIVYRQVGEVAAAQSWQQQSISFWARRAAPDRCRDDDELARLACDLTGRGSDEFLRGRFELAESFWRRALAIEEWRGDWEGQAADCGNLGLLAAAQGDLSQGVRWLRKSLSIHQLLFDRIGIGTDWLNLSELLRLQGDFRRSQLAAHRSVKMFMGCGAMHLLTKAQQRLHETTRLVEVLKFDARRN